MDKELAFYVVLLNPYPYNTASALALFWLGGVSTGVVSGIGFDLTFMELTKCLIDAYSIFSSFALASSVISRNISAALLVSLESYQMYEDLEVCRPISCLVSSALYCLRFHLPYKIRCWIARKEVHSASN